MAKKKKKDSPLLGVDGSSRASKYLIEAESSMAIKGAKKVSDSVANSRSDQAALNAMAGLGNAYSSMHVSEDSSSGEESDAEGSSCSVSIKSSFSSKVKSKDALKAHVGSAVGDILMKDNVGFINSGAVLIDSKSLDIGSGLPIGSEEDRVQKVNAKINSGYCPQDVCSNAAEDIVHNHEDAAVKSMPKNDTGAMDNPWNSRRINNVIDLASFKSSDSGFSINGRVSLDKDEAFHREKLFKFALVGRVIGRKFSFIWLVEQLRKIWSKATNVRINDLGDGCFIAYFDCLEDRDLIWLGGPWFVAGYPIAIDLWTPNFSPSKYTLMHAPLWVRLPGLPLEYWGGKNLYRIGELIGDPIRSDAFTAKLERTSFARICVKCDFSKPLRHGAWLDTPNGGEIYQQFIYEGPRSICSNCGIANHVASNCPSSSSLSKKEDVVLSEPKLIKENPAHPLHAEEWQVVAPRRKKNGYKPHNKPSDLSLQDRTHSKPLETVNQQEIIDNTIHGSDIPMQGPAINVGSRINEGSLALNKSKHLELLNDQASKIVEDNNFEMDELKQRKNVPGNEPFDICAGAPRHDPRGIKKDSSVGPRGRSTSRHKSRSRDHNAAGLAPPFK